ncbi:hypothetical protein CRG98_034579 [Punica granatum]|uniref:Uncharacterized protein n=1 Tax=Punica granatum TaxID=22663 RepID=A0A2I0IMX4_PUNGR|nr:hypothetical protein CRG98_034579 [Punica granatum]
MHVRGARRTGRAAGVHGRRAGGVRWARRAADVRGHAAGHAGVCGYGCTVHSRARPSPGMMELT